MTNTVVFDMFGVICSYDNLNPDTEFNPQNHDENVKSIQNALDSHSNKLNIFPIENGLNKLKDHLLKNDNVVIVSTSSIETQKLILKQFLDDDNLLKQINFYSSSEFGPKSDPETWFQILKNFENITQLYEDTPNYLEAAQYAVRKLGNENCKFSLNVE